MLNRKWYLYRTEFFAGMSVMASDEDSGILKGSNPFCMDGTVSDNGTDLTKFYSKLEKS